MSLRNVGGYISAAYNPLAANVGSGTEVIQTEGVFSLQTAMQAVAANQWCTDPYFKQTTLLLQADNAANAAQNNTFLDSSANNFTLARTGSPPQGSFSPFSAQPGYWSGYFNGTGYYATFPFQSLPTTASTFTIEAWVFQTDYPVAQGGPVMPSLVGDQNPTASGANWCFGIISTGALSFWWNDTGTKSCVGNTITALNTWTHIAVSVSANAIKLFVNGVLQTLTGTTTLANRGADQVRTTLGQYAGTNSYIYGYVSNLRIVVGTALYSTSFTPSKEPLTAISGTTLLTLQNNNTFKDASTNNRAITPTLVVGRPFSPAASTYAYLPAITGGSAYFSGSSQYLSITGTAALVPDSVFTFEAWIYFGAVVSNEILYSSTTTGQLLIGFNTTTSWGIGARAGAWLLTTTTLPTANQWNHVVVCRGGTGTNQTSLFLNGVRVANGTVANAFNVTANYQVGYDGGSAQWTGFISNLRLVKSDVYGYGNTTITVPTAPLTAITNTALLLNFTNSGIVDNALNNVIDTVGNAQVSTSIKKYGSGSMYFDGTGDWLSLLDSSALQLGPGNFTVEGWFYLTALGTARGLVSKGTATTGWSVSITSGNFLQFTTTAASFTGTTALVANTWYHFAFVRYATGIGNIKLYLNGVLQASSSTSNGTNFSQTDALYVGANRVAAEPMLGYMDDVRITKAARYTAAFTPPTIAFQRQ